MLKLANDCFRDYVIYYKSTQLQTELAITVDAEDDSVKATYNLNIISI